MSEENIRPLNESELSQIAGGAGTQYYIRYTVVKGDTLGRIAHRFGTTVDAIMNLNPIITNANLIKVGWELIVPDNR